MQKIVVLFLALLFAVSVSAQIKPFKLGFKVAPSISWMSANDRDYENEGAKGGFLWGVVTEITLTKNYFVSTGLNYNYLNGHMSYAYQDATNFVGVGKLDRVYKMQYLEIPLALKLRTNDFGDFRFFGQVGLTTAFRLKARSDDKVTDATGSTVDALTFEKNNIASETALLKESMLVGAGVEYLIDKSLAIIFGLNYNGGFTNMLTGKNNVTGRSISASPSFFELSISVVF